METRLRNSSRAARWLSLLAATAAFALPCAAQTTNTTNKTVVTRSWTGGVQTAAVQTTSTTTVRPAITRDTDNPDRLTQLGTWWSHATGLGDGGAGCGSGFSIPDGARIVIEFISVKIVSPTPLQGPYVAVYTNKTGSSAQDEKDVSAVHIALQNQGTHYATATTNAYHYTAAQPVRLVITNKSDWLCEAAYVGPDFVNASAHYSYFGYITQAQ